MGTGSTNISTQLFVGSLSVADLGMMLSYMWVQAVVTLEKNWRFGYVFCKVFTDVYRHCGLCYI